VCPPARRDWELVTEMSFEKKGGVTLTWPPVNWKGLSGDQKLMAQEHAAVFLEKGEQGDFPSLCRRTLVDKYNFLTLEGANKPNEEEGSAEKIDTKIRQYNFSYIRALARGEISDNRVSWGILRSMERAARWEDTDKIISVLEGNNVKIKI